METALEKKRLLIKGAKDIPVFSFVISKLVNVLGDPKASAKDVMHLISVDPGLSARVLHLANSAYYGLAREIDTIHRAVVVLGFNTIISLSISSSMGKIFEGNNACAHLPGALLWKHSMGTAVCAKLIAHKTGLFDKETAFIAGLLHDLGKLLESSYLPEDLGNIIKLAKEKGIGFKDAEVQVIGMDHCEVAATLLKSWAFPSHLVESIQYHHEPIKAQELDSNILASIINFADFIANEEGFKSPNEVAHPQFSGEVAELLGCSEKDIEEFKIECKQELEYASKFLQLPGSS